MNEFRITTYRSTCQEPSDTAPHHGREGCAWRLSADLVIGMLFRCPFLSASLASTLLNISRNGFGCDSGSLACPACTTAEASAVRLCDHRKRSPRGHVRAFPGSG